MTSSLLLSAVTFIYMVTAVFYLIHLVFRSKGAGRAATAIAWFGLAVNTVGIILRWVESYRMGFGHAPLSNLYESLVFFSWTLILIYLLIEWRYGLKTIGAFATPFAFLSMAYGSFSSMESGIQPLIPALKSNWLIAHVFTCFLGYAAFAVSCGISIMYLFKSTSVQNESDRQSGRLPSLYVLNDISYRTVLIGFLMLSMGIITGAVWAHSAWGTYWSWDPKETWSLITWLVYATLLHARFVRGWDGRRIAVLSIVGFVCVMFTYFGVNFLLKGLHSYGTS